MALLEMIDGDQQRQPGFACRGFRRPTAVRSARQILLLETANPLAACGARDMQDVANTALGPPLAIEGDQLCAGLGPSRVTVVTPLRERRRAGPGAALQETCDRFM